MKLMALESLDPGQIAKALSRRAIFLKAKGGVNRPQAQLKAQPKRTGDWTVPVSPEYKGLMGQSKNPHGTLHSKPGRELSLGTVPGQDSSRPTLVNLGQPFERGLSDTIGDAEVSPVDKGNGDYKTRREGPAEDPGRKRDGSLGFGRSSQGLVRYSG